MNLDPWYLIVTPRQEVRAGRSFNPDEFAIALEQVVNGSAPEDYKNPARFFERTVFTRALREHTGMVLRRLSGETNNTAPVLTLITQFGGGKTHTLTMLYHLARYHDIAAGFAGIPELLSEEHLPAMPACRVAVFVGNAWDPQPGRETPWIDMARQLAGDAGVAELGVAAASTPPGTDALGRVFAAAGGSVLILFDEVLNFMNRHRGLADSFYAFLQNLTVATTGNPRCAAVISLPRSQVEMTEYDLQWQERITKVVRRVAKDLIANDESEIAEVVRRRMFEDLGSVPKRRTVAKAFADWCFERRAQLPPEWTAVDSTNTEAKAREFLQTRFEACYPFHPATLSVFQRKWQALPQYQQTRGTLAMLAQWISWAYRDAFTLARKEPLLTLGSAPLEVQDFRSLVLGQLGEPRLNVAIMTDIAGPNAHARVLDVDTQDALRDIHRRTGTAILFESSGGQADKSKVAHLPELRFALGEPGLDTTTIDNAATALESRAFFISRVGTDGFRISHKSTLKKVVNDRRASLDEATEVLPEMRALVKGEFDRGCSVPIIPFPADGDEIANTTRLTLVVLDPRLEWTGNGGMRERLREWAIRRGGSNRLSPAALVWCLKKPGRELREKVEMLLAWRRVKRDFDQGALGDDIDQGERSDVQVALRETETTARDEVWASYRFVVLSDAARTDDQEPSGLKIIDLGAGHSSSSETLCGRVITAMKTQALLNESPGAGYLDRRWPVAFRDTGAWPLLSLRQAFLNGSIDRVLDPDAYLRVKIPAMVASGDFGLASRQLPGGGYERVWFAEPISPDEVAFESDVYLLKKAKAQELKNNPRTEPAQTQTTTQVTLPIDTPPPTTTTVAPVVAPSAQTKTLSVRGAIPPEIWNRLGTKLIPKLRSSGDLKVEVSFTVTVNADAAAGLRAELNQILRDLGIADRVRVEVNWHSDV